MSQISKHWVANGTDSNELRGIVEQGLEQRTKHLLLPQVVLMSSIKPISSSISFKDLYI